MAGTTRSILDRVRELDLDLSFGVEDYTPIHFWMQQDGKRVVVGYLSHDHDASDPIEDCDGMGKFIHKHTKEHMHHLGRDSDGDPILDDFIEIIDRLRGRKGEDAYTPENDAAAAAMWEEASIQGKVGTPYAVAVTEAHHSGYREWNRDGHASSIDAVWIPDESCLEHINSFPEAERAVKGRECFEQALEEFNKWAEGDCWGVVIDVFDRLSCGHYHHNNKESESCWGYIGSEYAEEELESTFNWNVKHYKEQKSCNSN